MTDQIQTNNPPGSSGKSPGSSSRFAIATRLGALKDIATFSDPFGTSARFHIRRRGSRAHKDWLSSWSETSPVSSAYYEQLAVGESAAVLTKDEKVLVESLRSRLPDKEPEVHGLIAVIDRLTDTAAAESLYRNAVRSAVESGKTTYRKVIRVGEEKQIEEALFLLAGWDAMPGQDDDGNPVEIAYSLDQARELMLNDTPLEGVGLDELILSVPAWCLTIDEQQEDGSTAPRKVIFPGLTLGRAYVLWVHAMSDLISSFREEVMGAAAKNSAPPSEATTSPGGGTKTSDDPPTVDDQPAASSVT